MGLVSLGEPLLCRLGFHKWQDYGNKIIVSRKEPNEFRGRTYVANERGSYSMGSVPSPPPPPPSGELQGAFVAYSERVYEKTKCTRCGMMLKRKLQKNSDGTLSSIGWELDTEETDNEEKASQQTETT